MKLKSMQTGQIIEVPDDVTGQELDQLTKDEFPGDSFEQVQNGNIESVAQSEKIQPQTKMQKGMSIFKDVVRATSETLDEAYTKGPGTITNFVIGKPYEMKIDSNSGAMDIAKEMGKSIAYDALRLAPFVVGSGPLKTGMIVAGSELGKRGIETEGFKDENSFVKSLGISAIQGLFAGSLSKLSDIAAKKYFSRNAAKASATASKEARESIEQATQELADITHAGKQAGLEEEGRAIQSQAQHDKQLFELKKATSEKMASYQKIIDDVRNQIDDANKSFGDQEVALTDALNRQLAENKLISEQTKNKAQSMFDKNMNITSRAIQSTIGRAKKITSSAFDDILKNTEIAETFVKPENVFENLASTTPFYSPDDLMKNFKLGGSQAKETLAILDQIYQGKSIQFKQAHDLKIRLNDAGSELLKDPSQKGLAAAYFRAADALDTTLESVPGSGYKLINTNYRKYKSAENLMDQYFKGEAEYMGLKVRPDFKRKIEDKLKRNIALMPNDLKENIDDTLALHAILDLADSLGLEKRSVRLRGYLTSLDESYKQFQGAEKLLNDVNEIKIGDNPLLQQLAINRKNVIDDLNRKAFQTKAEMRAASRVGKQAQETIKFQESQERAGQKLASTAKESEILFQQKKLEDTIRQKGGMLRGSDRERVASTLRQSVNAMNPFMPNNMIRGLQGLITLMSFVDEGSTPESKLILDQGIKAYQKMLDDYSSKIGAKGKILPEHISKSIGVILNNIATNAAINFQRGGGNYGQ